MDFLRELVRLLLLRVRQALEESGDPHAQDAVFLNRKPGTRAEWEREWNELQMRPECGRYRWLRARCGALGGWVLDLTVAALAEPGLSRSLPDADGAITIELAVALFCADQPSLSQQREAYETLRTVLYCRCSPEPFFRHPFTADERLYAWLSGENVLDIRLREEHASLFYAADACQRLFARQDCVRSLQDAIGRHCDLLQMAGQVQQGKQLALRHACKNLGRDMLFVDVARLLLHPEGEQARLGELIRRETVLCRCGVCFSQMKLETFADEKALRRFIRFFLEPVMNSGALVCVGTESGVELIPLLDGYVERVEFPDFTRNERIALWEGYAGQFGLTGRLDCIDAGSRFLLNGAQIRKAAKRLAALPQEEALSEDTVSAVCSEVLPSPTQGSIKRIEVRYTLEDLKLPADQKQKLDNICAHVKYRHLVYDEWNMESRFAYGRNVSALFVGPPGTGKTMAVHVLSSMLRLPLYRIDLSQVVDKYIGETEKRLEEIFSAAEKNNTILFFDEADAIFGKRSEVSDSKDRYANTEVSYILQRIEHYDGVVILATNYKRNIDEAFMRRMRYLVEFIMPSCELRREIWLSSFSPEIPVEHLDYDYLARQFELSGGSIKNIVLNAAFMAAQDGTAVQMHHILDSIRSENAKVGKPMLKQDFAEYGALIYH